MGRRFGPKFSPGRSPDWIMHPPLRIRMAALAALSCLALLPSCRTVDQGGEVPVLGAIDQPTFARMDKNADGLVSLAEMAAYKHQEGLAEIDLDDDKRVSPAELAAARPSQPQDDGWFARLDRNGDGFLSEEEAVAQITQHAPFVKAFKAMDQDGDGQLTWEEFEAGDPASLNVTLIGTSPASAGN